MYKRQGEIINFKKLSEAKCIRFSEVIPKTLKPLTIPYSTEPNEIQKNLKRLEDQKLIDYASLALGGTVLKASNEHYGPAAQVISPFPPINMFDGMESARSRKLNHSEEVVIQLGKITTVEKIILNFKYFVNNNPLYVSIEGCSGKKWTELAPKTKVKAFASNKKEFLVNSKLKFEQVRVVTYPDGGINRIQVFGPL